MKTPMQEFIDWANTVIAVLPSGSAQNQMIIARNKAKQMLEKEYKVIVSDNHKCVRTEWRNIKGELHREDVPAMVWTDGQKSYYINGELHREDGPAVESSDGIEWYFINGKYLTKQEFNQRTKSCEGKVVEIDGKKYKLTELK